MTNAGVKLFSAVENDLFDEFA